MTTCAVYPRTTLWRKNDGILNLPDVLPAVKSGGVARRSQCNLLVTRQRISSPQSALSVNRSATALLLLTTVVSSVAHAQRATTTPATFQRNDEAEAVTALRALFAAAERNDMKALDTLYAGDSLTVIEGAGINRGWIDYRDHHLAPEMKEMKNFHYRPVDIEMHVSGNTAWAIYRYNLKGKLGARTLDNVGRGTAILEHRGSGTSSRWIVRHTQTSSRARRPSDPPAG